jgi:hypothetical protein
MGAPLGHPGHHREHGRRAVQRLDLRFFVDTEHDGVLRGVVIYTDDVDDFVGSSRLTV